MDETTKHGLMVGAGVIGLILFASHEASAAPAKASEPPKPSGVPMPGTVPTTGPHKTQKASELLALYGDWPVYDVALAGHGKDAPYRAIPPRTTAPHPGAVYVASNIPDAALTSGLLGTLATMIASNALASRRMFVGEKPIFINDGNAREQIPICVDAGPSSYTEVEYDVVPSAPGAPSDVPSVPGGILSQFPIPNIPILSY